jgi:hypothetical protein
MVLVDYIGIFSTFPNTFDRWLFVYIGLSLPIILTLLSMIIDNEKPGCKYTHNLIINVMICIYFVWGSKYKTNSKYRHPRYYGYTYVIGLHKSTDVLFHKMLSSSNQCNQSIIVVFKNVHVDHRDLLPAFRYQ